MSDDTPTKVLPTATPTTPSYAAGESRPRQTPPSRGPLVAFIVLAVLFVGAVIVLANILISRTGAPVATPTSTSTTPAPRTSTPATPRVSAPPAPAPLPAGVFSSFFAGSVSQCSDHGRKHGAPEVQVSWSTANATQVWVAPGSGDAVGVGEQVPLAGDQSSFPAPLLEDCVSGNQTFTMTLVGADDAHVSRTWTVMIIRRRN